MPPLLRKALRTALAPSGLSGLLDEVSVLSIDARQIKCPLKKGDELFRDAPDAEVDKDMKLYIEIVFGEPQILPCTMLAPTLLRMANSIDDIIVSFKPFLA